MFFMWINNKGYYFHWETCIYGPKDFIQTIQNYKLMSDNELNNIYDIKYTITFHRAK